MPALVVLDDLHLLCPAPSQSPEAVLANIGSAALVAWLRDVLKEYHARPDGRPSLPGKRHPCLCAYGGQEGNLLLCFISTRILGHGELHAQLAPCQTLFHGSLRHV